MRSALPLVALLALGLVSVSCRSSPSSSERGLDRNTQIVRLTDRAPGPVSGVELSDHHRPVIPGSDSQEIPLPPGLADFGEGLTFEAWLALAPEHQVPEVEARFRVSIEDGAGRRPLLEQTFGGGEEGPHGLWHPISVPVILEGRGDGRGTIVLETEVRRRVAGDTSPGEPNGGATTPVTPAAALWGNPRLLTGHRQPGPNLLIVAVDTLRADVVGAWGDPHGLTPNLDRFSARSVRFADLVAPAPWTLPSFATLLTGLPPEVHGAGRRLPPETPGVAGNGISRLPSEAQTLAEVLGAAGLETASRYNNVYLRPTFGVEQGFDEHRGFHFKTRAAEVVNDGIRWLEEHRHRRFFVFFHLLDPHTPYFPPRKHCLEVARRLVPKQERQGPCRVIRTTGGLDIPSEKRDWAEALYRAEVAFTDLHIGRLLRAVGNLGLAEKTVILFVSDHGEELWENQELERRYGYTPIADHGHSLYRELLHVPGILHVPQGLGMPGWEPGVWEEPVELADLFPTLLGLLGVPEPAPRHGSESSSERGPAGWRLRATDRGGLEDRVRLAGFLLYGPERMSVRRGPWKLILPRAGEPGEQDPELGGPELYHLERDPEESRNLAVSGGTDGASDGGEEAAREMRRLVRELRRKLKAREELRRALGLPEIGERARADREQLESLEALGYLN